MKKGMLLTLTVFLLLSCGCGTFYEHPDPKVSYPAKAGQITGAVVAIPVDIVLAPVLYPVGAFTIDPTGKADGPTHLGGFLGSLLPSIVMAETLGNTVGACSWVFFGWWGNDKKWQEEKRERNAQDRVKQKAKRRQAAKRERDAQDRAAGLSGINKFTAEELHYLADQYESEINTPQNTDDPISLQRRADKLRALAIQKEKALDQK